MEKSTCILRLGTRASPLALTQSRSVARALERAHRSRGLKVELIEIATSGDRDRKTALKTFGGTGVFVKELETALLEKRVDFAVHSLKDLPILQPKGLTLASVTKREDVRDVAITTRGKALADLPQGAVLGCGSPRRQAQLILAFPHLRFKEIRGNVDTRLRKVAEGKYAGTILARAGLKRLMLPEKDAEVLPLSLVLPAPGQGALGLECRSRDVRTKRFLQALHDPKTSACVEAERACLAALGGGCHLPLGALGRVGADGRTLRLTTILAWPDESLFVKADQTGRVQQAKTLGRQCARKLALSEEGKKILPKLDS